MKLAAKGRVVGDCKGNFAAKDRIIVIVAPNELFPAMMTDRIVCDPRGAGGQGRNLYLAAIKMNFCRGSNCWPAGDQNELWPTIIELNCWRSYQACRQCAKDRIVGDQN